MIKLKDLLEQQLPDASATDLAQGLNRDPMTGNPLPGGAGGNINLDYKEIKLDQLKFDDLIKLFRPKDYFNSGNYFNNGNNQTHQKKNSLLI